MLYFSIQASFPPSKWLDQQHYISAVQNRSILVDWLVEIHYKHLFDDSSLWLAITILDRYLQTEDVPLSKLQLVGIASLHIATKFEEINPPKVADCVEYTDNSYTAQAVLEMEANILNKISYQISGPTGFHFISYYLSLIDCDDTMKFTALFYAERSLQEQHYWAVLPSHFTAAAVMAALWKRRTDTHNPVTDPPITASEVWPAVLEQESGYSGDTLMPCAKHMILHAGLEPVVSSQRRLNAARRKFKHHTGLSVSKEFCFSQPSVFGYMSGEHKIMH
jgi:hypothetical protein